MARGAHIYAELAGAASTADAHHITAPSPDGSGAARCMELALADAQLVAARRDPHQHPRHLDAARRRRRGGGHLQGFRCPGPAVTSIKGVIGHTLAAAGAIEAVAVALTIEHSSSRPRPAPTRWTPPSSWT